MGVEGRDYMRSPGRAGAFLLAPRTTWWLIGINAVLWFVYASSVNWSSGPKYAAPDSGLAAFITQHLVLWPRRVIDSLELWQPFTAMWLHDPTRLWHVFVNMLLLFFFGRSVESYLGRGRYLWLFIGGGLASTVLYIGFAYLIGRFQPALGASGAVYAVMVWLACREPNRIIYFMFAFRMPLWVLVGLFLVGREVLSLTALDSQSGSAVGHLAGAAWGWVYYRHTRFGAVPKPSGGPGSWIVAFRRRRAARRLTREQRDAADVRHRVDRLLEKISAEGIDSLTEEQKAFLQEASKRYK